MAKTITVIVHADGRMDVNLAGFKGLECERDAILAEIQAMLKPETVQEQKKSAYYQRQGQRVQQKG